MPAPLHLRSARRPALLALALAGLVLSDGGLVAQEDEETRRHGIFIDSVEISLVNVEVIATSSGEPVTDLRRDDFELFDDGQAVEITHFSRVEEGRRLDAKTDSDAGETAWPAGIAASREPSTVVVMVDQLFVSPASRRQVFDAVSRQLESLLAEGARIMVAGKERDVEIAQDFTTNGALVSSTLERLTAVAPPGYAAQIRSQAELWDITPEAAQSRQTGPGQAEPALATSVIDAQSAYQDARALSQRIHADLGASLATLHRFVDSLAGLPGRKAILYVADQLPARPAEQLWQIWWERYGVDHGARLGVSPGGPLELDLTLALEEVISDANASRVAFYPIGGEAGADFASASARGLAAPTLAAGRVRTTGAGDGLEWLAERTGGRAARGADFDTFLNDMADDLGTYYSIGYRSPHEADGEVHRLELRVRRPGVELRYPTEYRDKSADQRMTDRTLAAITLGSEENPLDVRVEVGKARRKGRGRYQVPIEIRVPMANLVLLPAAATHRGTLSIQIIARNADGDLSDPVLIRLPLEVAHRDMAWALSQTVDHSTELTIGPGTTSIAIGVHDDLGLTGSTIAVEIDTGG